MAGYHPAMGGAFSIMEFPDEKDPMVVYLEHRDSAMYRSDPAEAKHYSGLLRRALAQTIPLEDVTL
jgi:hypothetical protein